MLRPEIRLAAFAVLVVTSGFAPRTVAEGTLQFSQAEYIASESVRSATIAVTRTDSRVGTVSADFTTSGGTATAGQDYGEASGTLTWDDGDTEEKTFSIAMTNDDLSEDDETVKLVLTDPQGAEIGNVGQAVLIITDNDPCEDGNSRSCYTGPPETEGVGICRAGTSTCAAGDWGTCQDDMLPETEDCVDHQDNDCDGLTDALDSGDCGQPDGGTDAGPDGSSDGSDSGGEADSSSEHDSGGGCASTTPTPFSWWAAMAALTGIARWRTRRGT